MDAGRRATPRPRPARWTSTRGSLASKATRSRVPIAAQARSRAVRAPVPCGRQIRSRPASSGSEIPADLGADARLGDVQPDGAPGEAGLRNMDGGTTMSDTSERAASPEDLTRLFVDRANAGAADGLADLYEPDAVMAYPPGQQTVGRAAIRAVFAQMLAHLDRFEPESRS